MRVLGIDPGSEALGWGVVDGKGSRYESLGFGVIRNKARSPFPVRLANVYAGVEEIVERFAPDVLAIEEAFYAANVSVAMKLGQVRGVVLLLAQQRGLTIAEYAPRSIKQTIVGYGAAEKHQVGEMVKILLGLRAVPTPHDASDALATAICHFHHSGPASRLKA